ncbi:MAG: alkaline phosphatase [Clostridiales bacterium]|jgi:alkaline phosphatase|nr:alkaline phosphatase [Clostridiales bacterium]
MSFKRFKKALLGIVTAFIVFAGVLSPSAYAAVDNGTNITYFGAKPKYVFMFIADGLSYSQMGITSAYLGAMQGKVENQALTMMNFPVVGSAATYDLTSFAPDSASTATSYATGYKTLSGVINMDETKSKTYETITEKLKKQMGWKIGIISSVNLNHATPAAFYGHQASRGNYYELSQELISSGFEYYAGGKLLDSRTGDFNNLDVYDDLKANGYTVATTTAQFKALKGTEEKVAVFSDDKDFTDDTGAMHYEVDRPASQPSLKDYVSAGIKTLENDKGFFMMVESGKVDWASHANDAASVVKDVLAFNEALDEAVAFAASHPSETLIIVTGDHETGGLSIGFAGTGYDTHLDLLSKQKVSFIEYDKQVAKFRENGTEFNDVLASVKWNFGLMTKDDEASAANPLLTLSDYELATIKAAYAKSMTDPKDRKLNDEENILYGTYEPFTVTLTHILNQKAGIGWTSYAHTGLPVPVFAMGAGEELFEGFYDNTKVFYIIKALTDVK